MVATSFISLSGRPTAVDEVVTELVTSDTLNGRYRINMPIVLCTGSMVDVSVWPEPDGSFMVSDDGVAHFEVSSGAFSIRIFRSVARERCEAYGARFDGGTMLFMRVAAERLRGAIIAMASLIKEVVDETITRAIKTRAESDKSTLFQRLEAAFPSGSLERDVEIHGESTASYTVDAVVQTGAGPVVFDLFSRDPISVAATFTKLSDVSRRDRPPRLIAVTRNPDRIGPKLQLIASVAPVVRLESSPDRFRTVAA